MTLHGFTSVLIFHHLFFYTKAFTVPLLLKTKVLICVLKSGSQLEDIKLQKSMSVTVHHCNVQHSHEKSTEQLHELYRTVEVNSV